MSKIIEWWIMSTTGSAVEWTETAHVVADENRMKALKESALRIFEEKLAEGFELIGEINVGKPYIHEFQGLLKGKTCAAIKTSGMIRSKE